MDATDCLKAVWYTSSEPQKETLEFPTTRQKQNHQRCSTDASDDSKCACRLERGSDACIYARANIKKKNPYSN